MKEKFAAAAGALAALTLVPAADLGFRSTVTAIRPAVAGLKVTVLDVPPAKGTGVPLLAIVLPVALGLGVLVSLLVLRLWISRRSRRAASTVAGAPTPRE